MAEIINGSLQQIHHHPNPYPQSLFHALDPISLILSQSSNPKNPLPLKLTTESFSMERGPRYGAYSKLRESRLRTKNYGTQFVESEEPQIRALTPPPPPPVGAKKPVRFQGSPVASRRKGSSILAQSVPDFAAALRKENRRPISRLPSTPETTPPAKNWGKSNNGSNLRGSKSSSAAEKRVGCGGAARKSYANIDELRGLTSAAARAINGENRTVAAAGRRTVLGSYRPI